MKYLIVWLLMLVYTMGVVSVYAEKPPPVSPEPRPTPIVASGKGSYGGWTALPIPLGEETPDEAISGLPEPIVEACFKVSADVPMFCVPDLATDDYFAVTVLSVMEQESGFNPNAFRITTIAGVDYEVRGCLQILLDGATRPLIASMGWTLDDLYDCSVSVQVAKAWYDRTNRGIPWRMWVAKPEYETSGHD